MPTEKERYGTRLREAGYTTYDPSPLMSKAPWSTPSPVLYGRKDHGAPAQPSRFPHGYADKYGMPLLLPDSLPLRQRGGYRGKGMSRLIAGGDHKIEGEVGGSNRPLDK